MKGSPDALPLMSFALRDLFEAEKTTKGEPIDMTLPEYIARGGLEEALERHANNVFAAFTKQQKKIAKNIFSRLIEVGQDSVDTRRIANFAELVPAGGNIQAILTVLSKLAAENVRLITTTGHVGKDGQLVITEEQTATITIAHEKMIDAWPWLRTLVDENRERIALQNQIHTDARLYVKEGDSSYLYRGGRLLQVEERLKELRPYLDALSIRFMKASINQRWRAVRAEEARRQKEIDDAQKLAAAEARRANAEKRRATEAQEATDKQSRLTRIAYGVGAVAIILAIVASFFGYSSTLSEGTAVAERTKAFINQGTAEGAAETAVAAESASEFNLAIAVTSEAVAVASENEARQQTAMALSRFLSNSAESANYDLGLLLAIEAVKATAKEMVATLPEANQALRIVLGRSPMIIADDLGGNNMGGFVLSADGQRILTTDSKSSPRLIDSQTGNIVAQLTPTANSIHSNDFIEAILDPTDNIILTSHYHYEDEIWLMARNLLRYMGRPDR